VPSSARAGKESGRLTRGYILGVGTNVEPERNARRIVEHLVGSFGTVLLSRFYETAPVGMESDRPFVNFCAFVRTALAPGACKAVCVGIEVALGRDRTHPRAKTRDRTADLDLLVRYRADGSRVRLQPVAGYLARPAAELAAILSPGRAVPPAGGRVRAVAAGGARLGEAPAAVDRDDRAGLVVVGQDRLHR
jgi:2-amino-4-hydroxy-6-hydroxymethyldihydropteridine diphosphokinase